MRLFLPDYVLLVQMLVCMIIDCWMALPIYVQEKKWTSLCHYAIPGLKAFFSGKSRHLNFCWRQKFKSKRLAGCFFLLFKATISQSSVQLRSKKESYFMLLNFLCVIRYYIHTKSRRVLAMSRDREARSHYQMGDRFLLLMDIKHCKECDRTKKR